MRDELREMIRKYEEHREPPKEVILGVPLEPPGAEALAAMTVTLERYRAHYTPEEEVEYLKALDHYTRELCKEENT